MSCHRVNGIDRCFVSKAASLALFWSFAVSMAIGLPSVILDKQFLIYSYSDPYSLIMYTIIEIPACFYPLAGFLADNLFGRYRVITQSLYCLSLGLVVSATLLWLIYMLNKYSSLNELVLAFRILMTLIIVLIAAGVVGFHANVIQFATDQLHDSPSDHHCLFVHWFVWVWSLGSFIFRVAVEMSWAKWVSIIFILVLALLLVGSLALDRCRKGWFLVDPPRINPYKLVYRVTRFAWRHKVPVHRSAFTYCEDEIPCGLDLGKYKYGGPFTTEQVEDVKAFYGILRVLLALGPVFFLDISADDILYQFSAHVSTTNTYSEFFIRDGWISSLLSVAVLPVYICLVRPFVFNYIPGMLKRIGLGVLLMLASCGCTLVMLTVAHVEQEEVFGCMFDQLGSNASVLLFPSQYAPYAQRCLASLFTVLLYPALYEFICSQSPHAMKGLLLGLCFAIKGLFEFVGLVTVLLFTIFAKKQVLPSCGMEYYILNVAVGVVALVVYSCIARRYKYRVRDEPCHVHRFVEEYYSKLQKEKFYDYSSSMD